MNFPSNGGRHLGPEHLTPLTEITDRREVLSRFIGPITNAFAIVAIDRAFSRNVEEPFTLKEYYGEEYVSFLIEPWFSERRSFSSSYEATIGLGFIATKIIGNNPTIAQGLSIPELTILTADQQTLLDNFDPEVRENDFNSVADNTIESQAVIMFRIALPAYLAVKYQATDPRTLREVFNRISLEEVEEILLSRNFLNDLQSMAFSPNGTYAGFDMDFQASEGDIRFREAFYRVDAELVEVITPGLYIAAEAAGLIEQLERTKPVFSVYNLFERKDDGGIGLSNEFVRSARIAIRLESLLRTNEEDMTPTDGCPAAKKCSRIQLEDFTEAQLSRLLDGPKPIASYDPDTGLLTMKRSPIRELHKIHMAAIREVQK